MNDLKSMTLSVLCLLIGLLTGCSGSTDGRIHSEMDAEADIDHNNQDSAFSDAIDTDGDGIDDVRDLWPTDSSKPITSSLWGITGESWDQDPDQSGIQSRLPFYGLAGYRDGAQLPTPMCTLNVDSFGATVNDGTDDTDAFWAALQQARAKASENDTAVVCISAGVYELSRQLHLNQSGIVLRGSGRNDTILNFKQGMIAQNYSEFVGNVSSNWDGNKVIVIGNKGFSWVDTLYLNELSDISQLPKQGDIEITLPRALTTQELLQLQQSGNRIRLMQSSHYSHNDTPIKDPIFTAGIYGGPQVKERVRQQIESGSFIHNDNEFTPGKCTDDLCNNIKWANGNETLYQQFVVIYQPGSLTMKLDRPVRFDMTIEDIIAKRPKLQLINSNTVADINIGIESLTLRFAPTEWGSCEAELENYACNTDTAKHSGYWAQGGVVIKSDFSWIKDVRFINSDNAINIGGDFNTASGIVIEADRLTTEGVAATQSPQDTQQYIRIINTGHVGIGVHGIDNLVDDVVMKTSFHHSLSMSNSQGNVFSNVRAVQPDNAPADSWGRETVKINMDHHRQIIHATLWTDIQLGGSYRMWDSTGDITEGFNAAASNTYWGINSTSPEMDHWPHNRKGAVEWGYHYINIVGTNIKEKPPAPQALSIHESPYPYARKNAELTPFPYHPDNAHLESIDPETLWPQNLYHAQREAYLDCKLVIKPLSCR